MWGTGHCAGSPNLLQLGWPPRLCCQVDFPRNALQMPEQRPHIGELTMANERSGS